MSDLSGNQRRKGEPPAGDTEGKPTDAPMSGRSSGTAARLLGRAAEFDRLSGLLRRTLTGRGGLAVIEGEPGIGKTALLDAAATVAVSHGVRVFRGYGTPLSRPVPFAAIRSCRIEPSHPADAFAEQASSLLRRDGMPGLGVYDQQLAVIEATLTLMDYWCSQGSVAVFIDDVQWADVSSLVVLGRMAEMVTDLPLAIVLAMQPSPAGTPGPFDRFGGAEIDRLRLNPLSDHDVRALMEQLLGTRPVAEVAAAIATSAGGNPLYVTELVAGLDHVLTAKDSAAADEHASGATTDISVPRSLTDMIVRRLDLLDTSTRHILVLAAVLGSGIEAVELSTVLDAPVVDVWAALRSSTDAGLLVRDGDDLVFRHDVVRQVLLDHVPATTRTALRHRAAYVLIEMQAPIERIADLILTSDGDLARHIVRWLIDSGTSLTVRAPELAVSLFARALSTPQLAADERAALQGKRISALLWVGRPAEAESAALAALADQSPNSPDRKPLQWLLLQSTYAQGRLPEAITAAETALAQPDLTAREESHYHGFLAILYLFSERFDAVELAAPKAISGGSDSDEPVAIGLGCTALGGLHYTRGDPERALTLAERIVSAHDACHRRGSQAGQLDPYALRAHSLIELDRLSEAEELLKTAVVSSRRNRGMHLVSLARVYFLDGRWDDALAEIHARRGLPDIFGHGMVTTSLTALIELHRGVLHATVDTSLEPDERVGSQTYLHFESWVAALLLERQGRPAEGARLLATACNRLAAGLSASTIYYAYPDLARLAALTDNRTIAVEVAEAAETLDAHCSTPSRRGTALFCRGSADANSDLIRRSAHEFHSAGRPLYEGKAHEELAVLLARTGRADQARQALDAALDTYEGLDAHGDIARAGTRLREYDVLRTRRRQHSRPKTGMASLTPTERKVAKLVAQGRSNSDIAATMFLSQRTVQSHVSSILTKLEVTSRVHVAVRFEEQAKG